MNIVSLCVRVADDADDDAVEDRGRAPDHVDVPERHGVERAGVDGDDRVRGRGHGAKRVSRAEPYRRVVTRSSGSAGSVRRVGLDDDEPAVGHDAGEQVGEPRLERRPAPVRRVEEDELVASSGRPLLAEDGERVALQDERAGQPERLEVLPGSRGMPPRRVSTNTQRRAPRESASSPSAPEPA